MKEIVRVFRSRYSTVISNDEGSDPVSFPIDLAKCRVTGAQHSCITEEQRRKSLKANRTMNPGNILGTFFSERQTSVGARRPKCSFLILAIGVLAITAAVLVKIFHPYDIIFKWKLVMAKNGEIFNLWEKPPIDLYLKVYLFNITNAEAFLAGRERLKVEQVGPYVYKEIMTHENVTFNNNSTMSGYPSHPLIWQEHLSEERKENDTVIMVDIALLSILHTTYRSSFMGFGNSMMLLPFFNPKPIAKMTAKEFMFGFPSKLTKLGNKLFPSWIFFESVGLIDRMYDFRGDFESFYIGKPNPAYSGLYSLYRGEKYLPQWDEEHCSNIEMASDGTKFKSFIREDDKLKFFRKSMCRPINLYRVGQREHHGSLQGYKFVFEDNALDNGVINEKNKCFCRKGICQPKGLLDVSDCYYKFPISLSYPHFLDGHEGLIKNVTGLAPNKDLHSSLFVVEPESGLPLSLSVKMQINMHFNEMPRRRNVVQFSHLTVPMLWFDITMPELPESLNKRFNFYINYLKYLDILGFWGGLGVGVLLLVYSVTSATLHITNITQADKLKFVKANMNCNNVYSQCEMKQMDRAEEDTNDQRREQRFSKCAAIDNICESFLSEHQNNKHKIVKNIKQFTSNELDLHKNSCASYLLDLVPVFSDINYGIYDNDDLNIVKDYQDALLTKSVFEKPTHSSTIGMQTDDSQQSQLEQSNFGSKSTGIATSISN